MAAGWTAPAEGSPAHGSGAQGAQEPDWFEQPLGPGGAFAEPLPAVERAARALDRLADQLRNGGLDLDARAPLDSDEAVLASVLAALFARRTR